MDKVWIQKKINVTAKRRGFHLVTDEIVGKIPEIRQVNIGLLHLFMQHTSASLVINENADPDVRTDMEAYFNKAIPENEPYYRHVMEGSDDMPAHLKSVVLGGDLTIPVSNGQLQMGIWQGIYLCEHRDLASSRNLIVTLNGE